MFSAKNNDIHEEKLCVFIESDKNSTWLQEISAWPEEYNVMNDEHTSSSPNIENHKNLLASYPNNSKSTL